MKQEQEMLRQLLEWAGNQENIRTVLMTSSRANPYAFTDLFTDYDFEIFVNDLDAFVKDDDWLKYMLDTVIRFNYLQPVIEWYIGVKHEWSVNPIGQEADYL